MWRSLIVFCILLKTSTQNHYQMFNCGGTGKCTVMNAFSVNSVNNFIQKYNSIQNPYGPEIPFSDIYSLTFVNSKLGNFPNLLLTRMENLRDLDLYECNVMKLSKNDLAKAQKLEKLGLGNNNLAILEDNLLSLAPSLKDLDLSKNQFQQFPKGAFMNCCQKLEKLNLSGTILGDIGAGFLSNFPALVDLDLSNNQIQTVDGTFNGCCQKLERLVLSGNRIRAIQDKTFSFFKPVQYSYSNRNNVGPPENLSKLCLDRNMLARFVCDFTVDELYIAQNYLEDITTSSCSIKKLDVSDNRLKTITINSKVTSLSIQNNQISDVICNDGANLNDVNFSNNSLSVDSLKCLSSETTSLDFSNNKIGAVTRTTFQKLQKVKTLRIPNTQITSIEQGSFYQMQNLQCLDISGNYLNTINVYEFQNCKKLSTFYCGGNQLTEIVNVNQIKTYMPCVRRVEISNNPWSCSYLGTMIQSFNQQGIVVIVMQPVYGVSNVGGVVCDAPAQGTVPTSYQTTTTTPSYTTRTAFTTTTYRTTTPTQTTRTTPRSTTIRTSTTNYCQPAQNAEQITESYTDLKEKLEKLRDRLRDLINDLKIIEFEVDVMRNLTVQYATQL